MEREEWLQTVEARRNPFYVHPEPRQRLWRYMDFVKFVSLLEAQSLFFSRSDRLGDALEGSVSASTISTRERSIKAAAAEIAGAANLTVDEVFEKLSRSFNSISAARKWERAWTYVSCWHMNDCEMAAMWSVYARTGQGIAIQTTFDRLYASLRPHKMPPFGEPIFGKVHYLDYDTQPVPENVHLAQYFHKRKSFAHENELRIVCQRPAMTPLGNGTFQHDHAAAPVNGISFPVRLDELIENIHVAPETPPWFRELITAVLTRYGLAKEVHNSRLDDAPLY